MNRKRFEKIIKKNFNGKDIRLIMLAYRLAKYGHRNQKRAGGERYFEHARGVAMILMAECGIYDRNTIIMALLHDIEEDSFILENRDIEWIFGLTVGRGGFWLNKNNYKNKKLYLSEIGKAEVRVRLVKLADRLHNLRDMRPWRQKRKLKYVEETVEHILPWAFKTNKYLAGEIKKICESYNKA